VRELAHLPVHRVHRLEDGLDDVLGALSFRLCALNALLFSPSHPLLRRMSIRWQTKNTKEATYREEDRERAREMRSARMRVR
jgi:hypothetical protein